MADKYYAVIDSNVIVSALISKKAESYPLSVMAHVYSGVIIPVFNNEIINEYNDVLSREKFHLNQSDIVLAMICHVDSQNAWNGDFVSTWQGKWPKTPKTLPR